MSEDFTVSTGFALLLVGIGGMIKADVVFLSGILLLMFYQSCNILVSYLESREK